MPLTASKTDTCTIAKTLDEAMGEVFAVRSACCAFWFQSVTTSARAESHRATARSAAATPSADFILKLLLLMVFSLSRRGNLERTTCGVRHCDHALQFTR